MDDYVTSNNGFYTLIRCPEGPKEARNHNIAKLKISPG